jgi:hypothetical protein
LVVTCYSNHQMYRKIIKILFILYVKTASFIIGLFSGVKTEAFSIKHRQMMRNAKPYDLVNIYPTWIPMVKIPRGELSRYLGTNFEIIAQKYLKGGYYGFFHLFGKYSPQISDEYFNTLLNESLFSINVQNKDGKYIVDMSYLKDMKVHPQCHSVGTILHLGEKYNGNVFIENITCIHPDGFTLHVHPTDSTWELAKLYAMFNFNYDIIAGEHPSIHFPINIIIAITHKLPDNHPLKWLLKPHTDNTLAINELILNNPNSVAVQHNDLVGHFGVNVDQLFNHNFAYYYRHRNRFRIKMEYNNLPFGNMLTEYYDVVKGLIYEYIDKYIVYDNFVIEWVREIGNYLYEFPKVDTCDINTIKDLLTTIIFRVSVEHDFHHHSYQKIPSQHKPWKIRIPPPYHPNEKINLQKLTWRVNRLQIEAENNVFFGVSPVCRLYDIKYINNKDEILNVDYTTFQNELNRLYKKYPQHPMYLVSPSIDS